MRTADVLSQRVSGWLEAGQGPPGPLSELRLCLGDLSPLVFPQGKLLTAAARPPAPAIAGVAQLVALERDSYLPERRWALGEGLQLYGRPMAVGVRWDGDAPAAVSGDGNRWRRVEQVLDHWEARSGWWTARPAARRYWRLALRDGGLTTVYRDFGDGGWYRQAY